MMIANSNAKPKKVMGVDLGKVDRAILLDSFKAVLKKDDGGTNEEMVKSLGAYFAKTSSQTLMECEDCGGASPSDYGSCPFCGGEDEGIATASEVVAVSVSVIDPKGDEVANGASAIIMKAVGLKNGVAIIDDKGRTEKVLDEAVAEIKLIQFEGSKALWRLGDAIRRVYADDLWKLRNDGNGKPKYKSFTQWVAAEVEMHHRTVFRMMEVAVTFEPEQAQKYGNTLLRGLLAAPQEDRAQLLEKVDSGEVKGARGLAAEVAKIRKHKGVKVVAGSSSRGSHNQARDTEKATIAAAEKRAAKKNEIVTVAFPAGRKLIELMARQLKKKDPEKRARAIEDRPWGKIECQAGVFVYVSVGKTATGELELQIEAKRDAEE